MNNAGVTMLSILIPSIPSRVGKAKKLLSELNQQISAISHFDMLGSVEVVYECSNAFLDGGPSIGKKRNGLVQVSNGKYVCFLDDDESVAPNYIETLMRLCNQDADVCTFRSLAKLNTYWAILDMRLEYKVNDQLTPNYTVRRPPWHICPVRAEFAKLYEFEDINNAEDFAWFEKVLQHCSTEAHTDKILFQYNHGLHSEADRIKNYQKN